MTKTARNQTLVTTWGRLVLGAFVFAWLNVAAQPCLMAMEMAAEPDMSPVHAEHGNHQVDQDAGRGEGADHNCGHCPPSGPGIHQSTCASMQAADCSDLPKSNIDGRQLKIKLKDVPGTFAVSQAPPQAKLVRPAPSFAPQAGARLRFTDGPSLNLRYCVFLK